jgi:hypothetical protein
MTTDRQIEAGFRALLADDLTMVPDRVLDAVFADLPVTRQRRRGVGIPGLPSLTPVRLGLAVTAIAVVVAVGLGRLPGSDGVGGPAAPSASPSPSVAPSPSPSPSETPRPGYGTAPPSWPTNPPLVPASPLPDPTGEPLPTDLIGREYTLDPPGIQDHQALVLTLRAADDPHCAAMYQGRSTCFTMLWTPNYPLHVKDAAVRGPARMDGDRLVLGWALIPEDPQCEGTTSTAYTVSADGWTLDAVDVPPCDFPARFVRH